MILKEVVTNYLFNDEIIQTISNYWKKHYYQEKEVAVGNIEEKLVKLREELDRVDTKDGASRGGYSFTAKWIVYNLFVFWLNKTHLARKLQHTIIIFI